MMTLQCVELPYYDLPTKQQRCYMCEDESFMYKDNQNVHVDTSVLLENTPLVKFIHNHIQDSSGIFSIFSLVRISMLSLISSLSLKLYLNSLVYDLQVFLKSLQQSSAIFGNFWKMFGNNRSTFGQFRRIFSNLWKMVGNLRKIVNYAVISMSIK